MQTNKQLKEEIKNITREKDLLHKELVKSQRKEVKQWNFANIFAIGIILVLIVFSGLSIIIEADGSFILALFLICISVVLGYKIKEEELKMSKSGGK